MPDTLYQTPNPDCNPTQVRDLPARLYCIRCHTEVQRARTLQLIAGRTYHSNRGTVVIIDPRFPVVAYCVTCSADLRVCSFCGCTDECACPGGCSWVQEDICSACAPNAKREVQS